MPRLAGCINHDHYLLAIWRQLVVEKPRSQLGCLPTMIFAPIGCELDAAAFSQFAVRQKPNHLHPIASKVLLTGASTPTPRRISRLKRHSARAKVLKKDHRFAGGFC